MPNQGKKERACLAKHNIPIKFKPIRYYAKRIAQNKPFAFVRYGEGEIKWLVPSLPIKAKRFPSLAQPGVRQALLSTVNWQVDNPKYFIAIQHLWHFDEKGKLKIVDDWIVRNLPKHDWHYAGVFRDATMEGKFYPIIKALRDSELPIILVGPGRLEGLSDILPVHLHIKTHKTHAFQQINDLSARILSIVDPAIFLFSCSFAAKVLIHRTFERRSHSFMIDFGSLWDGYLGMKARPYHPYMTKELITRNLNP